MVDRRKRVFHGRATRSTMAAGTTRSLVIPLLEAVSGKRVGVDLRLTGCPELLLGDTALDGFGPTLLAHAHPRSSHTTRASASRTASRSATAPRAFDPSGRCS